MKNARQLKTVLCTVLASSAIVFLMAGFTMAQTNSGDSPLLPWIGVWTITNSQSKTGPPVQNGTVEIRPTADRKGLEITRKNPSQPDISETLIPDGTRQPISPQNCKGWRSARWIPEAGMILETSDVTCKDTGALTTSTLKLIVATDQMAEILSIKVAGQQPRVAVRRLTFDHDLPSAPDLPPAWVGTSARTALSANWNLDKIIRLSKEMDTQILEAAMIEKKVKPALDSKSLKQMQNAQIPKELIDLTVALAYPTQFHIEKNGQVELRPWLASSSSTPSASTAYAPMGTYYPGSFYNCYSPMGLFGYSGFVTLAPVSCWSYYSPLWWDYPIYWAPRPNPNPPVNTGTPVANPGGYAFVQPIERHARPRDYSVPTPGRTSGGGSGSWNQGSYGASSAGSSAGSSSGGASGGGGGYSAPSASPGGYSSGGEGGGRAVPR